VSYAIPWVSRTFVDGENAALVPFGDTAAMAARVHEVMTNHALRIKLGAGAARLARSLWSNDGLAASLAAIAEASA